MVAKYVSKLSGPLLDRIDLQIEIARVPFDDMVRYDGAERSEANPRARHSRSQAPARSLCENDRSAATPKFPAMRCADTARSTSRAMRLLAHASAKRQFSARALDRIARVARTIADLCNDECIRAEHVAEAIQYRSLERLGAAA